MEAGKKYSELNPAVAHMRRLNPDPRRAEADHKGPVKIRKKPAEHGAKGAAGAS